MKYIIIFLLLSLSAAGQQEFFHAQNKGLLLDEYPNAAAAYSLRRVNSRYTGPLIRVRRDSTGQAEQDIGSLGEALDTVALKAFIRNNSGFVTTWYDQSGNARNATQTTAAAQPRIVSAGVVDKLGNKPSLYFDGSNDILYAENLTAINSNASSIFTALLSYTSPSTGIYASAIGLFKGTFSTPTSPQIHFGRNGSEGYIFFSSTLIDAVINATLRSIFSIILSNNNTAQIFRNGVINRTGTGSLTYTAGTFTVFFGGVKNGSIYYYRRTDIQEFILYSTSNTNRTQIEQNINSYYAIY